MLQGFFETSSRWALIVATVLAVPFRLCPFLPLRRIAESLEPGLEEHGEPPKTKVSATAHAGLEDRWYWIIVAPRVRTHNPPALNLGKNQVLDDRRRLR